MPNKIAHEGVRDPERYELRELPSGFWQVDRREFFEIVGAGLLIAVTAPTAIPQRETGTVNLEARLHIGADGTITVLSGKVEEGQGPRTELTMAAAEELEVPLDHVKLVMADTDVVPNDGITAGSRTTPGTVPAVRKAAAAARKLLLTVASQTLNLDRDKLVVRRGIVTVNGRQFTYSDLARSSELAAAYRKTLPEDINLTATKDWRVLGTPHVRPDGRDIVTGTHRYPSDIVRPDMLYGTVLRPPSYGATLVSADLSEARKMPGVTAVQNGEFVGCAAKTSFMARKALNAISGAARWKQPAEHPSSDTLFEYLKRHAKPDWARVQSRGSVEEGLANAKSRLKAEFRIAYVQHAPMEPRAAVAEWQEGKLTVWTGTSNPFGVREQLARFFQLNPEQVRVVVPDMGGGFGGKHTGEVAVEAARLAKEAGRPVSLRWTREEEFMWAYYRPAALIEVEAGMDANEAIVAWDFVNYNSGGAALDTPYQIANTRVRFVESDSPLRQGSYRCLAATANNFAREAFTDELAHAAGRDPLEFRLAHLENERLRNVLEAAAERFGWSKRRKEPRRGTGIGLACGAEKNSVVAACVEVRVDSRTGVPHLIEIVEAFECGPVLNPAGLRAQVEGCIMMGLGPALREQMGFREGRLINGHFASYKVPRFRDVPKIELVLLDRKDLEPAGAGETPIMAVAPAMANAMFDATGTRKRSMPLV
jgi:CO/xanthine dehydrogenase Mo-binding subunit